MAVAETGWHGKIAWQEGGWTGVGRGRMVGEKKGGVGMFTRGKAGRQIEEIQLKEDGANLGSGKGDILTVKLKENKECW